MAFTNIYDVTFPPDTQLANLLGQDLRSLALNVQQRMAAISGLDAAKPAFGADAQPANWNGLLFFATDTGKIYKWTNPAWNDVTAAILLTTNYKKLKVTVPVTLVNPGVATDGQVIAVPSGFSPIGSIVRIGFGVRASAAAGGTPQIQLNIAGTAILVPVFNNNGDFVSGFVQFGINSAATVQVYGTQAGQANGVGFSIGSFATIAANLTAAWTLKTRTTNGNMTLVFDHLEIEAY